MLLRKRPNIVVVYRCVVSGLACEIGRAILSALESLLNSSSDTLFQNEALQLVFDIKFVSCLLAGGVDNKSEVSIDVESVPLRC